jgi:hypothetical protein
MYVTGATEGDATSIPADVIFNDEVDLTDQAMLSLFNSRLQNSNWKISQRFSTPSFNGFGINLGYESSDQREYMVKCDSCGHWQVPEFNHSFITIPGLPDHLERLDEIDAKTAESLDITGSYVCCEKCRAALDLGRSDNREWVAKKPDVRHSRGYKVRPFSCDRITVPYILTQLLDYKKRDYLRGFYNTVLGEPYNGGDVRLEIDTIEKCYSDRSIPREPDRDTPVSVGIDLGTTCHIMISTDDPNKQVEFLRFEVVPSEKEQLVDRVAQICDDFNVVTGAVDRHPYTPTAEEIYRRSNGLIIPAQYQSIQDEIRPNTEEDEDLGPILVWAGVNRTAVLDKLVNLIRRRRALISGYGHYKSVITSHLRDMVRDEQPEKPAIWRKLSGQDHFFHAMALSVLGYKLRDVKNGLNLEDQRTELFILGATISNQNKALHLPLGNARSRLITSAVLNG